MPPGIAPDISSKIPLGKILRKWVQKFFQWWDSKNCFVIFVGNSFETSSTISFRYSFLRTFTIIFLENSCAFECLWKIVFQILFKNFFENSFGNFFVNLFRNSFGNFFRNSFGVKNSRIFEVGVNSRIIPGFQIFFW